METDLFQDRQFEHVVSLGHACAVAGTLERMGYREHSGPFDWNAARLLKTRIDCINDNFKLFFDSLKPDCLVQRQVPSCYYLEPCEFFMVHDFNEWAPVEDQIERVKLQYRRRVNVFLKDIKEPTLFIYYLYEGEDAKYINENMDFIVASLKKHNILNEIIFIADNKYQINYPCFYVQNPPNVDIADDFAVQNIELFRLLNNIPYPENKKKRNLEFVRKNRKFKIFRKVKKKIKRAISIKLYGIYHHSRTWFD